MKRFDFDTKASRENMGNMKYIKCPENIRKAGIISFSGAEPEYKTAPSVIKAMVQRAENGLMGYTLADETYYEPIRWWFLNERDVKLKNEWIVPTLGMSFAFNSCVKAFTKEGDGVIIQQPTYHHYQKAVENHKRRIVYNDLINEDGLYRMDLEGLERLMADKNNRMLVLCNPQNPTGNVWGERVLAIVAGLSKKYGVYVYCDEIFAEVSLKAKAPVYSLLENASDYGISATSLGKTFGFTGTNQANMIIPGEETRKIFLRQRKLDHFGSIDPLMHAAIGGAYSPSGAQWKDEMVAYVRRNSEYITSFIKENMPVIKVTPCEGGYVMWLDFRALSLDEDSLMAFLRDEALFDPDRGSRYDRNGEGFVRMNISAPIADIKECMERLLSAMKKRGYAD